MIEQEFEAKLKEQLPENLHSLLPLFMTYGSLMTIPANQEILKEGQYVKVIPVLLSGLAKVLSRGEERDLLLYYIEPGESCIMSFVQGLNQEPSKVYAITEAESEVLLLPATMLDQMIRESPEFNRMFHQLSNQRYLDLLLTINQVFFDNLEERLLDYLHKLSELKESRTLSIKQQQIANDLGTAREVVSRVLKKLAGRGLIRLENHDIILL